LIREEPHRDEVVGMYHWEPDPVFRLSSGNSAVLGCGIHPDAVERRALGVRAQLEVGY
jgi:hypothetical protein